MNGRHLAVRGGCGDSGVRFFGMDVEEMSPASKVVVSSGVVSAVALSAVFLAVVAPAMWWLVTIYGWIVFPALGVLASGLSGRRWVTEEFAGESEKPSVSGEQQLLEALARNGELTPTRAALETSLSVAQAGEVLGRLADEGHLQVSVREGGLFYSMWEARDLSEHRRSSDNGRGY